MQKLFDNLDRISTLVDQHAWSAAIVAMRAHDADVREERHSPRIGDDPRWKELFQRQQSLALKFASLRSDALQGIADLRRGKNVAKSYLAIGAK